MSFNPDKFERAKFEARTKVMTLFKDEKGVVSESALSECFDEGSDATWTVRGLSASELHRAMEAGSRQKTLGKVLQSIADNSEGVAAAKKILGFTGKETPGDIAKRIEMLVQGSVDPVMTLPQAVKLAENFPIEFYQLTNEITELTGMGFEHAKPQAALQKMTV